MTTAIDPGCTCGAAEASIKFEMQVDHQVHCYISLKKEADAVEGVQVRQVGSQPVNQPAPADELYAPATASRRQAVNDPGPETEFCKIRFVPGLPHTLIETYNTDGKPSIIQAGRVVGQLINVREIDTSYGPGTALDIKLQDENPEINGIVAGCFASSMLRRMIQKVRVGSNIEIIRIPSVERWHVYEVYILD